MTARTRSAGRPLMAVLAVLASWVAIRASVWEPPFALPSPGGLFAEASQSAGPSATPVDETTDRRAAISTARHDRGQSPAGLARGWPVPERIAIPVDGGGGWRQSGGFGQRARSRSSVNHQLLYAAAFAGLVPGDPALGYTLAAAWPAPGRGHRASAITTRGASVRPDEALWPLRDPVDNGARAGVAPLKRWAADAWVLVREGGAGPRLASANPAGYGGNQAGAVARYSLAPGSAFDPRAYARVSKALVSGGETELATGLSIALTRKLPLRLHGELRVTERPGAGDPRVRPAAFVVTGVPQQEIVPGIETAAYMQAGYVGGDFATGFVDGQATIAARVGRRGGGRVTLGGGAWGGAQRDAARLDLGPTASTLLSTGKATMRASIDYRVRVAGDAPPRDGVAVTLAASF